MPKIVIEIEVPEREARALTNNEPVYVMWADVPPSDECWWIDGYAQVTDIKEA